jgi:hypothetical protein
VLLLPTSVRSWDGGAKDKEHAMSQKLNTVIAVVGIDIGKNSLPLRAAARFLRLAMTVALFWWSAR